MPANGRFPAPEIARFRTGNGIVEVPGYYWGENTQEVGWQEVEGPADESFSRDELPPAAKGMAWAKRRTVEGKLYWIEAPSEQVDQDERLRAERERKEAEQAARIRQSVQRSLAESEAASSAPAAGGPGSQSGLAAMRARIASNARSFGEVLGASVKVTETATGFDVEVFEAKAGVSTAVDGKKLGNITLDANGNATAVDLPGATITKDGRVVVGKDIEVLGLSIHAKAVLSVEDGVRGAGSEFVEMVTDFGERLGLGKTTADRDPTTR